MALSGRVVVVAGASGIVGGGLAQALLEQGATVVAPVRSERSKAKALEVLSDPSGDRLHLPILDVHQLRDAEALGAFIKDKLDGSVDHVVSLSGATAPAGLLTEATPETVATAWHDKVHGHLWLAKALVPLLRDDGATSYTIVTGALGEICPWPTAALTAVGNGASYALAVALQAELKGKAPRVNELRIAALIRRDQDAENPAFPGAPAAPASTLAAVFLERVVRGDRRDAVVRVGAQDLGL